MPLTWWQTFTGKGQDIDWLLKHGHLIELAALLEHPTLSQQALHALSHFLEHPTHKTQAHQIFIRLMDHRTLGSKALSTLTQYQNYFIFDAILEHFFKPSWHLHKEAIGYIASFRNERALHALLRVLKDPKSVLPKEWQYHPAYISEIRCEAIQLLQAHDCDETLDALISLVNDPDLSVKKSAIKALDRLNYEDGLVALHALLKTETNPEVVSLLEQILGIESYKKAEELLEKRGFRSVAGINYILKSAIFWHPELKLELMVTQAADWYILKGMKKYYIKAVSDSGQETWQRNLGELMEKLRVSFPEFHLYACGAMNILPEMVPQEMESLGKVESKVHELASEMERKAQSMQQLQQQLARRRQELSNIGPAPSPQLDSMKRELQDKLRRESSQSSQFEDAAKDALGGLADKLVGGSGDLIRGVSHEEKRQIHSEQLAEVQRMQTEQRRQEAEFRRQQSEATREFERQAEKLRDKYEKSFEESKKEFSKEKEKLDELVKDKNEFVKQYIEKGVATCYIIGCSTHLRMGKLEDFKVMLEQTLEDIKVAHTYGGFTQMLERGLHIYHEELQIPYISHMAEMVGLFTPDQLQHPALQEIKREVLRHYMVSPAEDIVVDGKVKEKGKRTPARVFQTFMEKVQKVAEEAVVPVDVLPTEGGWMGNVMYGDEATKQYFFFPMHQLKHGYVSGTTGSGKSSTARVLVENALVEKVNVIILDPTRQWCGLAFPNSGSKQRLKKLGVEEEARKGFPVQIYTPEQEVGTQLPSELTNLLDGCHVVSMKGLEDDKRCEIARNILQMLYENAQQETEKLRTLLVLEEAHAWLPDNVSEEAQAAAEQVRMLIDRISREKRKYGLNLLLVSQSLADFKREARVVREMTNSKFFMRAIDQTEVEYVEGYISPEAGEIVKNLKPGEALVYNPMFRPVKVFIRAPFSDVHEPTDQQIKQLTSRQQSAQQFIQKAMSEGDLTEEESQLLEIAKKHLQEMGEPIFFSKAQEMMNISNARKMQALVDGLANKGRLRIEVSDRRGKPKLLIPS